MKLKKWSNLRLRTDGNSKKSKFVPRAGGTQEARLHRDVDIARSLELTDTPRLRVCANCSFAGWHLWSEAIVCWLVTFVAGVQEGIWEYNEE